MYFNSIDRFNRKIGKLTTFFCFLLVSRSSQAPQSQRLTLRRPLLEHLLLLLSLLLALQQLQHSRLLIVLNLALALLLSLRRSRPKKVFTVTTRKSTSSKNEMVHALLPRPPRRQSPRRLSYISSEHELHVTCRSNEKTT
jgi:hypothetical protein